MTNVEDLHNKTVTVTTNSMHGTSTVTTQFFTCNNCS